MVNLPCISASICSVRGAIIWTMKYRFREIIRFSLIVAISLGIVVACIAQEQPFITGVHIWVNTEPIGNTYRYELMIVNNTPYPIQPAENIGADQWRIFRKTEMGWQEFAHKKTPTFSFRVEDIDQWLPANQRKVYEIRDLLYSSFILDPLSVDAPKMEFFEPSKGGYTIEVHYNSQTLEGIIPLITYTPVFSDRPGLGNDPVFTNRLGLGNDEEVKIAITPRLQQQQSEALVNFEVFNQSDQKIWIASPEATKTYPFGPVPLTLIRKVDDISWELVQEDWPQLDQATEPVGVISDEVRTLTRVELNTELRVDTPGEYRFIIPIFLEYYPKGIKEFSSLDPRANAPILNELRLIFTDVFTIH